MPSPEVVDLVDLGIEVIPRYFLRKMKGKKNPKPQDWAFRSVNSRRFHRKYPPSSKRRPAAGLAWGAGPDSAGSAPESPGNSRSGKAAVGERRESGRRRAAGGSRQHRERAGTGLSRAARRRPRVPAWQRQTQCQRLGDKVWRGRSGQSTAGCRARFQPSLRVPRQLQQLRE